MQYAYYSSSSYGLLFPHPSPFLSVRWLLEELLLLLLVVVGGVVLLGCDG